jgi:DUF4097 and DUF4098 domain-containing protein YvlB
MSSVPPNYPPGGGVPPPVPPYDPRAQGRYYREQQKAAWRAQREAWKAQRHAWKENYKHIYGPHVPSVVGPVLLIGVGVVAMLVVTGKLDSTIFWTWYSRWWPLLLIAAGLLMLGEWAWDMRRKTPVRRGGGFVWILIVLAILGVSAAGWHQGWGMHFFGDQDDNLGGFFGLPAHETDRPALTETIPANARVEIQNPRGDVSVTAGDQSAIEVQAHELAYSGSDSDAQKIFDAEAPRILVNGNAVTVTSASGNQGRVNLSITVPKTAQVLLYAGKGDVKAAGLGVGLQLNARGDVQLSDLSGPVQVRFSDGRHDFSAHQMQGDLSLSGDCSDFTLSDIKGKVTQSGDILGDVHFERVTGPIHLHTSVTDLEVAELTGDLNLDSDSLSINEAKGLVRVVTHAKDIDLSQIYGDSYVENRNGRVAVEPAGSYSVNVQNSKGDIEITLPPNASATVDGRTRNGEIENEYGLPVSGDTSKSVSGRIGSGTGRIALTTDNGDVKIKRGSGVQISAPPQTNPGPSLKAPRLSNAPHLKTQKALPPQPIQQ